MDEGSAPYWFPVVTLILGAVGGYLADYLREARGSRRARRAAADAFERDTLIALQDALSNAGVAAIAGHEYDDRIYHRTGQWGRELLPAEVRTATTVPLGDVQRYRVRVRDDAIREAARSFAAWCVIAQKPAFGDEDDAAARERATEARDGLSKMSHELHELIGERLRELL